MRTAADLIAAGATQRHDPVAEALDKLQAEDARVAGDAEAAFARSTGCEPGDGYLCTPAEVPVVRDARKWITDLDGNRHIATALGRLLELVGLAVTRR